MRRLCLMRVMWRLGGGLRMGCMEVGGGFCFSRGILVRFYSLMLLDNEALEWNGADY